MSDLDRQLKIKRLTAVITESILAFDLAEHGLTLDEIQIALHSVFHEFWRSGVTSSKPDRLAEKNYLIEYGKRLRSDRKAAGILMSELARHLGISVAEVSDVELGYRAFTEEQAIEAEAFIRLEKK